MITTLATPGSVVATAIDEPRHLAWFVRAGGELASVPLSGGPTTVHQTLDGQPAAIAVTVAIVLVTLRDGSVLSIDGDSPHTAALPVATGVLRAGQMAIRSPGGRTAAIVTSPRRRLPIELPLDPPIGRPSRAQTAALARVSIASGTVKSIAIPGLAGVAISGATTFVARNSGLLNRGDIGSLRGATVTPIVTGLPRVGHVGTAAGGTIVLAAHPGAAKLSAITPSTTTVETVSTAMLSGSLIEAHGLVDGRILVATDTVIAVVDTLLDLDRPPSIDPIGDVFLGSWAPLHFDLGTSGLGVDDIRFEVPDGYEAGFVSNTRIDGVGDPVPLLVVGGAVGPHKVVMVEIATSSEIAAAEFEIIPIWPDDVIGPAGYYSAASDFADGGWGGGPGTPQNIPAVPHSGTWRSLVLMVDTSDQRWPTGAALDTARTDILGHVTDGITTAAGADRSTRRFYEENSGFAGVAGGDTAHGMTLGVHDSVTFGPVALPGDWDDYFTQKFDDDGVLTDDRYSSRPGTLQTIISQSVADGIVTTAAYGAIDVIIVVVASPDAAGAPPARFVWPHANSASEWLCGPNALTDRRSFAFTFVPLDFAAHDGRQMHTTLSHELGHTLGLPDLYDFPQYSDDVSARITGDWEMMAGSRDRLPHFSLSNKMRMGWIPGDRLKLYNFQGANALAENVTLHAAELGAPPAGQVSGIEIRLGDGWNYYVEYRAEQGGFVTDDLVTDQRIMISDVTSDSFTAPLARPPILFVRQDIDGDGDLIGTGADFEETDPGTLLDLKVEVVSAAVDNAVVRVSYGSNGRAEPGIRPWSGEASGWKSPDIEVRNDKSDIDPANLNVPWLAHDNRIVARVTNSGDIAAVGVTVDFSVMEYSSGDGPLFPLGFDRKDIGAGATEEFQVGWNPIDDEDKHYCVVVRIRNYQDPNNLAVIEKNIYDNEARSNFTRFISASSSPSSRVGSTVQLANPFDAPTRVFAKVRQTHPQHRVFVDHQWLRVPGSGSSPIRVWDEAVWSTPEWVLIAKQHGEHRDPSFLWEVPNLLSVQGEAERPFEADCGARTVTGGVGIRVDAGRATLTRLRGVERQFASGVVDFVDNGASVTTGGQVLVELRTESGKYVTAATTLQNDGRFAAEFANPFGDEVSTLVAHYLGSYSAAPSASEPHRFA